MLALVLLGVVRLPALAVPGGGVDPGHAELFGAGQRAGVVSDVYEVISSPLRLVYLGAIVSLVADQLAFKRLDVAGEMGLLGRTGVAE